MPDRILKHPKPLLIGMSPEQCPDFIRARSTVMPPRTKRTTSDQWTALLAERRLPHHPALPDEGVAQRLAERFRKEHKIFVHSPKAASPRALLTVAAYEAHVMHPMRWKTAREMAGVLQNVVLVGLDGWKQATLSKFENGKLQWLNEGTPNNAETLVALASAYSSACEVDGDWLRGGRGESPEWLGPWRSLVQLPYDLTDVVSGNDPEPTYGRHEMRLIAEVFVEDHAQRFLSELGPETYLGRFGFLPFILELAQHCADAGWRRPQSTRA